MAVKKTQMYRRNLDGTETRLNPLTESQYVLMENGQTVQEVLSDRDSDKYTPVITNSSSTFKVGQGDNVDLSSSMKEGAYDSCVLKGKTMVNCIQEPSSKDVVLPYEFADGQCVTINDTKESGALGVELKGQTLVNLISDITQIKSTDTVELIECSLSPMSFVAKYGNTVSNTGNNRIVIYTPFKERLKLNEDYTIVYDYELLENPDNVDCQIAIAVDMWGQMAESPVIQTKGSKGRVVYRRNRASNDIATTFNFINNQGTNAKWKISNLMLLEGDWTNKEIPPYFEGMTSVKMPTLHTIGKNLLPYSEMFVSPFTSATPYITKNGAIFPFTLGVNGRGVGIKFKVEPNTTYTLSSNAVISNTVVGVAFYKNESDTTNHNYKLGISFSTQQQESIKTFTTPSDCNWIVCGVYILYVYEQSGGTVVLNEMPKLQLEKNAQATTYESYKSSILSLPEEVVLRSLPNGVCDTFNTRTGVYTQRIGEVQLQDVDRWDRYALKDEFPDVVGFYTSFEWQFGKRYGNRYNYHGVLPPSESDKLPGSLTENNEVIVVNKTPHIKLAVNRTRLNSLDSNGLKQWLKSNPITLQYQLATPIITKINLPSTLKSWNTTTHIYSEIPENTLHPILSHSNPSYPVILKPSTKYSIVANSYSNNHTNSAINFNLGGATTSTTVGNRVTTITTPSTLTSEELVMRGRGNKLNNVMIIEGNVVGDEPYFEGICDCKSPILSNCGKNLLDIKNATKRYSSKSSLLNNGDGSVSVVGDGDGNGEGILVFSCCVYLKEGETYFFSFESDGQYSKVNGSDTVEAMLLRNASASDTIIGMTGFANTFVCPRSGDYYLRFDVNKNNVTHKFWNVYLAQVSTDSPYEPYKSNTTTFEQKDGKTIVLRSLPNGVCDTLNVETGECVQRIGQNTFDGSENWTLMRDNENENILFSCTGFNSYINVSGTPSMLCDKIIPKASWTYTFRQTSSNGIALMDTRKGCRIGLVRSEGVTNVDEFKAWLSQNPITIQYELAEPIVSTIDVQGFPYAYTNGHVQLSSGYSGQSLTPTVEYSLSANKTGQIDSNTRQVIRHQKQLDDFEAMMLTSMVQSAYDKAILQFDYEMRMMSLGGE